MSKVKKWVCVLLVGLVMFITGEFGLLDRLPDDWQSIFFLLLFGMGIYLVIFTCAIMIIKKSSDDTVSSGIIYARPISDTTELTGTLEKIGEKGGENQNLAKKSLGNPK